MSTIYGAIPRAAYKQHPRRNPRSMGFERYTLAFNGVDQAGDCGNDASLDITGEITVEVLLKRPVGSPNKSYLGRWWMSGADRGGYGLQVNGRGRPTVVFGRTGGFDVIESDEAIDDLWHYIAMTRIGTTVKIQIDDEEVATSGSVMAEWNSAPATSTFIASGPWPFFLGNIALARIYGRALSIQERHYNRLNYHNPIRNGLRLWLPIDEGAGETIFDKSGLGNHATLLPAGAGPTWERVRQWELRAATE